MNTLNFATYAKTIKKGIHKATNIEVTKLLLDFIVSDENVLNKEGEQYHINNYYVNKWINQHTDIPASIKKAASCPKIIAKSEDYFDTIVINKLSPQKELDTYCALLELIKNDTTISDNIKNSLISLYQDNELGKFLSDTFLYALQKDMKKSSNHNKKSNIYSSVEDDLTKLNEIYSNLPSPKKLIPPDSIEDHEMTYIMELLAVYADEEGVF